MLHVNTGGGSDGPFAWNPNDVDAPGANPEPLQDGADAVTADPLWVIVALHALTRLSPLGHVQCTDQDPTEAVPVFLTVTVAVNPPCQLLSTW